MIANPKVTNIKVAAASPGLAGRTGSGSRVAAYVTPPAAATRAKVSIILAVPL
jgi:hypothetical protein